ncbi:MAG: iron-containing alcohol dehydrogenase [Ignavibacteria bacterium]
MDNFDFYNPVKIIFGKDQLKRLRDLIPTNQKVLILYGGGSIHKNGVYKQAVAALKNHEVYEFSGIEPNPRYETAMKAVEIVREKKIDMLLAIGGGSVIDAAKFIAVAALYEGTDPWDILTGATKPAGSVPIGVILTLPATGSEMNSGSVITKESTHEKLAFMSPLSFPKFSFLLPEAAATLPKKQIANGVVDAFVHVIEQYVNYPVNTPLQDRFAESILQTLVEEGPKVYANPADYDAMSNLMLSATIALNGLIGMAVPQDWSIHGIGHELTALHEIDHARTLAIVLPGLWKIFRKEKKEKILQYGKRVWQITEGSEEERVDEAIARTVEFFESLGVKTKLKDYNVQEDSIEKIAVRFEERGWKAFGDRRLVTPQKVREILMLQLG